MPCFDRKIPTAQCNHDGGVLRASVLSGARRRCHFALLGSGLASEAALCGPGGEPNSATTISIVRELRKRIQSGVDIGSQPRVPASGTRFEHIVHSFVDETLCRPSLRRRGKLSCRSGEGALWRLDGYQHLAKLARFAKKIPELAALLGSWYVITPDVLVVREPESDDEINCDQRIVDETVAMRSSLRQRVNERPILHASISCKWTLRSDRAQNARSEALNLIRNRKGRVPHIVVVTGEPLPSRLASLALGTGDIDCVYHFALPELIASVRSLENAEEPANMVDIMVDGKRLKDISDLPLDLAV